LIFIFLNQPLNPFQWNKPAAGDTGIRGFGHFLCLDRWGPASDAEAAQGMPYHGEAAHVEWQVVQDVQENGDSLSAVMSALLPKAGLAVQREVRCSKSSPFCSIREEVTNRNPLGRMFNIVQHPTIAPPFLDETTLVDSNARHGFAQGGSLPEPEEPSFYWPSALNQDRALVNLRHLTTSPDPAVVSYTIDDNIGWVVAATPAKGLLVGYLWNTRDYPWVSFWRDTSHGKPSARGLEFGSTGLHQPFPILARKAQIWGRPTFEFLDSGEHRAKSYAVFLLEIPPDFHGVDQLRVESGSVMIRERSVPGSAPRTFKVSTGGLEPK
jgi:hypothetical protein